MGHKATDLDSIASAIGAAELYNGIAARASDINHETKFALDFWKVPVPPPFLEVADDRPVVIVDHNQIHQSPDGLQSSKLCGCIDHHAMQGATISTSLPIYIDIRPWGSACTIVAHMFFRAKRQIKASTAGMLLSGILSDTLNLRSPTTTEHDRIAVSILAKLAKLSSVDDLADSLFHAKTQELASCAAPVLVRGDLKNFTCRCADGTNVTMCFGVIETTDVDTLVNRKDELAFELRALKAEEGKDLAFLALVDVGQLKSKLILIGSRERDLATRVFNGEIVDGLMDLGARVSRKKEFIPPIEAAISAGWVPSKLPEDEALSLDPSEFGTIAMGYVEGVGCQLLRQPPVKPPVKRVKIDAE